MHEIKLLSPSLQNQIAAGEVVERPASIVKELIENSIDAGSNEITIEIFEGGIKKIRVIDNGSGINPKNAQMAFQRYATSKIERIDDLFSLHSFGFRGEALASIASVSHMVLKTKRKNDEIGIEISPNNPPSPCALQKGTEIIIENVFWNVPARKKFLKSENAESREIFKIMEKFALSHPEISFNVKNNGKEKLICRGRKTETALFERCKEILTHNITDYFLPLQYDGIDLSITGFTTHPNFQRSNRAKQYIFVNNRIIDADSSIYAAISQAYETLIPRGKFPSFILKINIRPDEVDVNVHPRKTEVKFHSPSIIFKAVKGAFENAIEMGGSAREGNFQMHKNIPSHTPSIHNERREYNFLKENNSKVSSSSHCSTHNTSLPSSKFPEFSSTQKSFSDFLPEKNIFEPSSADEKNWSIVGQLRKSFIIVEEKNGVRIVDQHAAHERVRLEKLEEEYEKKNIISQPLLSPCIFSLSVSEKEMLMQEKKYLEKSGFEIEDFGGNDIAINAVPSGSEDINIQQLFSDLLADCDFFDSNFSDIHNSFSKRAISYTACRGAKKFGDILSHTEMEALISDWKQCKKMDSCAHGRPVSVFYPYKELENECARY